MRYGAGQGAGSYLYLSGETGIGAGLVVDGDLFRGAHGAAGELGHVVVDPDGPACGCGGAGCLEQYAGLDAVMRAAGVPTAAGTPARVGGPGDDPAATSASRVAELLDRLGREDRQARLAVERAGRGLGIALIGAVNLLDPDTVVLGGVHARLADHLISPIEAALARGGGRLRGRVPTVRASALGSESAVRGAAATVLARVFADPLAIG
ncbi:ROK family protein [Embleya sp. NPDC020886]|uniref:ROK family protein n=1 Tax=Embleya sp. NPDC020886 TaxID=3363980 RepID=UPI0037A169AD